MNLDREAALNDVFTIFDQIQDARKAIKYLGTPVLYPAKVELRDAIVWLRVELYQLVNKYFSFYDKSTVVFFLKSIRCRSVHAENCYQEIVQLLTEGHGAEFCKQLELV